MPDINYQPSNAPVQPPRKQVRFIFIPIGLIITLIIAVFQFFVREKNPAPEIDQTAMNSGIHYYMDGDYDMAIVMFNQVIFQQPESGDAYNNLGLVYEAKGELPTALANFAKAIEKMPAPAAPYCNRANIYLAMGDFSRAMSDLDQAIQLDPEFSKAFYNRGLVELALNNPESAITNFSKAIEFSPMAQPSAQKIQQLGATLSDPFGIMEFSELTATYADPKAVYAGRARAYFQIGDLEKANADLDSALQFGLDAAAAEQLRSLFVETVDPFQPGHWQGTTINGGFQGPVSFDLDADGVIHNFKMDVYIAFDTPCPLSADGIVLDSDQWFSDYFDTFYTKNSVSVQGVIQNGSSASGNISPLEVDCYAYPNQWIKAYLPTGISWQADWQPDKR